MFEAKSRDARDEAIGHRWQVIEGQTQSKRLP
jgi:hypothetical protein